MYMWDELADNNQDFKKDFNNVFNNPDVNKANYGCTANLYDQYVNMELTLNWVGDRSEFTRVKKILKDANVRTIGVANDNPILDSRMYEVE